LEKLDPVALLRSGYTDIYMKDLPQDDLIDQLPLRISNKEKADQEIKVGKNPSLILRTKDGTVKYAVINGFLWKLEDEEKIRTVWSEKLQ
jgi:hypothetical protein